jgi:hypothetical protein
MDELFNVRKQHAKLIAFTAKHSPYVLSDEDLKDIGGGLEPDEIISAIVAEGPPYTENEIRILVKTIGDMDDKHNFNKYGEAWKDDAVDKYAAYIHNYLYKYKPEATEIDPSIDPNEDHIGPMAQDIEKVNPACIEETEDGVKTVDTGRLALMNAGVIAQLARDVKELKDGSSS